MKKPKLVPIQVTIFEGDVPIGGWIGMTTDPSLIHAVVGDPNHHPAARRSNASSPTVRTGPDAIEHEPDPLPTSIERLARRNKLYTTPRPHMKRQYQLLERHVELTAWLGQHNDNDCLTMYAKSMHTVWWDWFDDKLTPGAVRTQLDRIAQASRLAYASWMMTMFDTLGQKGRDARYTLRTAIAGYKRGDLKLETFVAKLEIARERLRLLRGK